MQPHDNKQRPEKILVEKIDELENLINKKNHHPDPRPSKPATTAQGGAVSTPGDVPVLDDLVSANSNADHKQRANGSNSASEEKLEQLIAKVENKLAGELENLVTQLKGNMKTRILKELKSELGRPPNNKSD